MWQWKSEIIDSELYKGLKPSVDICRNDIFFLWSNYISSTLEIYRKIKFFSSTLEIYFINKNMARNVEIKAFIENKDILLKKVNNISTKWPELLIQKDTFFNFPFGKLKLREINKTQFEIILYFRNSLFWPKKSKYYRFKINNLCRTKKILGFFLWIKWIVKKQRKLFYTNQTRIHIDNVESLGDFIELEVEMKDNESIQSGVDIANNLIDYFWIKSKSLIEKSYLDILLSKNI